jgi:hypothetical protein
MFAGRVARPVTVEEMDAAIEAEVAARNQSSVLRVAEPAPRKRSR